MVEASGGAVTDVRVVYGVPCDSVSLVAAASLFPRWQNMIIAFGIIGKRHEAGTLSFKADKQATRIGALPREVIALMAEHYWPILYTDKKLGMPHFEHSTLCPNCARWEDGMLEEVMSGEDCDNCRGYIQGWFEHQGRSKRVHAFLKANGFQWLHQPVLNKITYVRFGLPISVIGMPLRLKKSDLWGRSETDEETITIKERELESGCKDAEDPVVFLMTEALVGSQAIKAKGVQLSNFVQRFSIRTRQPNQAYEVHAGEKQSSWPEKTRKPSFFSPPPPIQPSWMTLIDTHCGTCRTGFEDDWDGF